MKLSSGNHKIFKPRVCTLVFVEPKFSKKGGKNERGESDSMQDDIGGPNPSTHSTVTVNTQAHMQRPTVYSISTSCSAKMSLLMSLNHLLEEHQQFG